MSPRRLVLALTGSLLLLAAAAIVVWSSVATSTARLSATTDGSGFFAAGTIDLTRSESTVPLLFDADGLYPGNVVTSCVVVDYEGSIDADVRLHATRSGGTGLEDLVDLQLRIRRSGSCPEDTDGPPAEGTAEPPTEPPIEVAASTVFEGRLGDLWRAHPDYDRGLLLVPAATSGDRLVLEAEAEVVADDDAQGRTTEFTVTIEARP